MSSAGSSNLGVELRLVALLSGDVDMVPNNMEASQAAILKQQWESAGRGTVTAVPSRLRQIQLQYRDPTAPWVSDMLSNQAVPGLS